MNNSNGEFKGSTRQALTDMKSEMKDLKEEVKTLRRWLIILSMVTTIAVLEKLPDLIKVATVAAKGF